MIEFIIGAWLAFMGGGTIIIMTCVMLRILDDIWRGDL